LKYLNLILIALLTLLASCASQQNQIIKKVVRDTVIITKYNDYKPVRMAHLDDYKISTEHYPAIGQDDRVRFLILHYTALDREASVRVLTQQEVSSHYMVTDVYSDSIYLLVDESKRAWHAGKSFWKGINNLNFSSIGIEIVNPGYSGETQGLSSNTKFFYDYPDFQIKKVAALAKDIIQRYDIQPVNVLAHSDIAPQRKHDPGPKFPWKKLYDEYRIGAWYEEVQKNIYLTQFPYDKIEDYYFIESVQKDLENYGYEIQKTGVWDTQTQKVITAFQYHFRPENYDGVLDAETWAILKALILKYRN